MRSESPWWSDACRAPGPAVNDRVWVAPAGRLESECVALFLESLGFDATADPVGSPGALVLLGVPGMDTARRVAALDDLAPEVPWLLVADGTDEELLAEAHKRAVRRVMPWGVATEVLHRALEEVLGRRSAAPATPVASSTVALNGLTDREREIVRLLSQGRHNGEIAAELGISYHTVRTHVQHVLTKLGMPHRHAVAALAQRSGSTPAPLVDDGISR